MKSGIGSRPLLESEIKNAQSISISGKQAAERLNVSWKTYVKWAKIYGINNLNNKPGKGSKKTYSPHKGKYPIHKLLNCEFPEYEPYKLKDKLIKSGLIPVCCVQCGFNEARSIDGKYPLLLDFADGNTKNHKLENLRLLCYNCYYNSVGPIKSALRQGERE